MGNKNYSELELTLASRYRKFNLNLLVVLV